MEKEDHSEIQISLTRTFIKWLSFFLSLTGWLFQPTETQWVLFCLHHTSLCSRRVYLIAQYVITIQVIFISRIAAHTTRARDVERRRVCGMEMRAVD